jgi:hypothetical protein
VEQVKMISETILIGSNGRSGFLFLYTHTRRIPRALLQECGLVDCVARGQIKYLCVSLTWTLQLYG